MEMNRYWFLFFFHIWVVLPVFFGVMWHLNQPQVKPTIQRIHKDRFHGPVTRSKEFLKNYPYYNIILKNQRIEEYEEKLNQIYNPIPGQKKPGSIFISIE
ncbi:hypothetical protein BLOT_002511 [Blomia tropicalis]|nr:hypothetical protein BLOT_002511 [Blomia tropicalis]